ncbi:hypothetical protein V5O48_007286 [Marasmius crinis-equi]|uniref:Mediator of RNA polymerase II transcription subunit 17 n=1 Tax=Marasmius crinis-equi TaxID=585013 RepID=A0ABR3FHA7_9AGAR
MQEPEHWKETRLSLERPYKNDQGQVIPTLFDITAEGELVYEPYVPVRSSVFPFALNGDARKESTAKLLGENLRRIFIERGPDFFEKNPNGFLKSGALNSELATKDPQDEPGLKADESETDEMTVKPMTVEELFKMRMEVMPQLFTALGEMSHARDLLSLILSSAPPSSHSIPGIPQPQAEQPKPDSNTLSATVVNKPPAIVPLQAFNAQLAIGGKDEALRKAAGLFKVAAERMERGRVRSEHYWVDALKIRRANWGLIPAPLPFGAPTGKGADRTTKDFVISYGLEESPPSFRRRAIAQMSYTDHQQDALIFPHRQNTHLRISVSSINADGSRVQASNSYRGTPKEERMDLNDILRKAQVEVIEQEIFSQIAKEAGSLPTASARVSERLILIDAAQNTELKFELVDNDEPDVSTRGEDPFSQAKCDFVYHYLLALLLKRHSYHKRKRLGVSGASQLPGGIDPHAPLILQPVIDILQYQVFCRRIRSELDHVCGALNKAGIPTTLRFNAVEEIGKELVKVVTEPINRGIGGEATLRVDDRYEFTFPISNALSTSGIA